MNYLAIIRTFLSAIHSVEALMPDSPGKEKLDVALSIVEAVAGDITGIVPTLTKIATDVVTGLRQVGVFKTAAPAAPATAPVSA